jgi:Na+/phosphate symporter
MPNGSDRESGQSLNAPGSQAASLNQGCLIMIGKLVEMALSLSVCISSGGPNEMDRCEILAKEVREQERALTRNLHAVAQGDTLSALVRLPFFLQGIGEKLENIVNCCRLKVGHGILLNGAGEAHCQQLLAILIDMMNNLQDAFTMTDTVLVQSIISQGSELSRMLKDFRSADWLRLRKGPFEAQVIDIYLDILDAIKSVNEDVGNICATLLELETISGVFANAPGQKSEGNLNRPWADREGRHE